MDYLPLLVSLMVVDLISAASPGPNFFVVSQAAVHASRAYALSVVAGIVVANLIWCSAVALGLSVLFSTSPWLYKIVKIAGGAYLVYVAFNLWRANESTAGSSASNVMRSVFVAFFRGLLVGLSNPKSLIYFSSIFAVFMAPGNPMWVQACVVGIVLLNAILWYGAVALLLSRPNIQRMYLAKQLLINRFAGVILGAFGARLILARE